MSRYLRNKELELTAEVREYVQERTLSRKNEIGVIQNYVSKFGRGTVYTSNSFFRLVFEMSTPQRLLFFKAMDSLKFTDDYLDGFCIEFTHKLYKDHVPSRNVFYKARDYFVDVGLFVALESSKKHFILSMDFIIKGKAKQPERDNKGIIIELNNINSLEK